MGENLNSQNYLVIVLDASNRESILEFKSFISEIFNQSSEFHNSTERSEFWVIFVLNKTDLENCITIQELIQEYELEKYKFRWHVHNMIAIERKGTQELLEILYKLAMFDKQTPNCFWRTLGMYSEYNKFETMSEDYLSKKKRNAMFISTYNIHFYFQ